MTILAIGFVVFKVLAMGAVGTVLYLLANHSAGV